MTLGRNLLILGRRAKVSLATPRRNSLTGRRKREKEKEKDSRRLAKAAPSRARAAAQVVITAILSRAGLANSFGSNNLFEWLGKGYFE